MISSDAIKVLLAAFKDSSVELIEASVKPSQEPIRLAPGDQVRGEVLSRQSSGASLVRISGQLVEMKLPDAVRPGTKLQLTFLSSEPRLTFAMPQPDSTRNPVTLSDTGRWLGQMSRSGDEPGRASQPLPAVARIINTPLSDTKAVAAKLQEAVAKSGVFYESHLAEWVGGSRPLSDVLQEPQGLLSKNQQASQTQTPANLQPATSSHQETSSSSTSPEPRRPEFTGSPTFPQQVKSSPTQTQPPTQPPTRSQDSAAPPQQAPQEKELINTLPSSPWRDNDAQQASAGAIPEETAKPAGELPHGKPERGQPTTQREQPPAADSSKRSTQPPPTQTSTITTPEPAAIKPHLLQVAGDNATTLPQPDKIPTAASNMPADKELTSPTSSNRTDTPPIQRPSPAKVSGQLPDQFPSAANLDPADQSPEVLRQESKTMLSASGTDSPRSTTSSPPLPREPIDPQTISLVRQQLATLHTGIFTWQGEAWAGQKMKWTVEERDAEGSQPSKRNWHTTLRLELPQLGTIAADLQLTGSEVRLTMLTDRSETVTTLRESGDRLRKELADVGLNLTGIQISHEETE